MTWTVPLPVDDWYMAPRPPPPARPRITPLARLSPALKLIVELVPEVEEPSRTQPCTVAPVTVRLPVTAIALAGTPCPPATPKNLGWPETKLPERPSPMRESRIRTGGIG